jgi:hypothetical protein
MLHSLAYMSQEQCSLSFKKFVYSWHESTLIFYRIEQTLSEYIIKSDYPTKEGLLLSRQKWCSKYSLYLFIATATSLLS